MSAAAGLALIAALAIGIILVQARRIARERDRANSEAQTAQQVTGFLVGLFTVPDPSESRGNTLTAREVLDKGPQCELPSGEVVTQSVYKGWGGVSRAHASLRRMDSLERSSRR